MSRLLEFESVSVGYDNHEVVGNVNIFIEEGEVVALLGRNGAGKTTILNTASGLVPALSGAVRVFERSVDVRRPHRNARRGMGHVSEGRSLFTQMSVGENLRAGASRRVEGYAMDLFPALATMATRRAGLLSGGEQQMLAIARALMSQPKLLLVDELSMGLAPLVARDIHQQLRKIAHEFCVGIFLVEQYVPLALGTADRAYVLGQGAVLMQGSGVDLSERIDEVEAAYLGA